MTGQVKRMGLVLSGGGAKGAYQAGVFQAMEEAGLCPRVEAISGCSIGAMNALLFATGDPALWRQAWEESDFGAMGGGGVTPARMEMLALQATQAGGLERYLQGEWLLPLDPLRQLARQVASPEKLALGRPRISVCAYQLEAEEPRYFWLDQLPFADAVEITVASTAIPVAFPPVEMGGNHYCDGGMTPPYSRKNNGDKTPILPLASLELDLLLVVYLNHYDQVDRRQLSPGTALVELYPSRPLEESPGARTMDFTSPEVAWRMELGYRDAMELLPPILNAARGGEPLAPLIAALDARNAALLAREQAANRSVAARARRVRARLTAEGPSL